MLDQVIKKVLLIQKALYLDYILLFLFDNSTSYSIYAKDKLKFVYKNKEVRE